MVRSRTARCKPDGPEADPGRPPFPSFRDGRIPAPPPETRGRADEKRSLSRVSRDADCVQFLQWALPRLGLRWAGFWRVRWQVCRRILARAREVGVEGFGGYRDLLEGEEPGVPGSRAGEWKRLEFLCRISISRFYRDRGTWQELEKLVLPELAGTSGSREKAYLRAWSAGCASGEEPYTLTLLWDELREAHGDWPELRILATDRDPHLLRRVRASAYPEATLKDLPPALKSRGFTRHPGTPEAHYRLRPSFRSGVHTVVADVREGSPGRSFVLILLRNLAFTYFDEEGQRRALEIVLNALEPGGVLVIGGHESLPEGTWPLEPVGRQGTLYRHAH